MDMLVRLATINSFSIPSFSTLCKLTFPSNTIFFKVSKQTFYSVKIYFPILFDKITTAF